MYLSYFRLKDRPFSITSDPSFIFFSRRHQEAYNCLLYGINHRLGFIEITGEIGCGKTTLCRAVINALDQRVKTAFVLNSSLTETQMMQTILSDLGLDPAKKKRYELFSTLNRFLIEQLAHGCNVALFIDEAQNLSVPLLEQVRMLSNLETEKEKLTQIILVGQPELRDKLNAPALKQLRQRIAVRYHLTPLASDEMAAYIRHRLEVAGAGDSLPEFTPEAIDRVFRYSGGVPRLINVLCDKALLLAFVRETLEVTVEMIEQSILEIEGNP